MINIQILQRGLLIAAQLNGNARVRDYRETDEACRLLVSQFAHSISDSVIPLQISSLQFPSLRFEQNNLVHVNQNDIHARQI